MKGGPLGSAPEGWTWRTPRNLALALVLLFGPSLWQAPQPPAVWCGTPAARVGPGSSLRSALQGSVSSSRPRTRLPSR